MDIIKDFEAKFDELNTLASTSYYTSNDVIEDILSILINAYVLGVNHAEHTVGKIIYVDNDKMQDSIYYQIEGKTFADRAREHTENHDIEALILLTESEYTRVYNSAVQDSGVQAGVNYGLKMMKEWVTMRDTDVRNTHRYLDGMTVPIVDNFYTYDGDYAQYPHGFKKAINNVNCRCVIKLKYT